jgi:hypothetical protein
MVDTTSPDGEPLVIELYGEARKTVESLARKWGTKPGDIVARALGSLWFFSLEEEAGRRVITERPSRKGQRLIVDIRARAGDAG